VHGAPNFQRYYELASKAPYSIQVGDFALDYTKLVESDLDRHKHKIVFGNHENYRTYTQVPHGLISAGQIKLGPFYLFYMRGGFSIDKKQGLQLEKDTGIKSWYKEEELNEEESVEAIQAYQKSKPKLVVTHDCPTSISELIGNPDILRSFGYPGDFVSASQETMQCMFEEHQPEIWLFGHYHKNWTLEKNGTLFVCLDELNYADLNTDLDIIRRGP
jgi:predicted phosphodiesterase